MSGSDGSVDILSGDRASAYCVQVGGRRFVGARKFPPSRYSTSYRSELEGIKLTPRAINETTATDEIRQYVDNLQVVESVNQAFFTPHQVLAPEAAIILACHNL